MRNLIAKIYCSRDRNTRDCELYDSCKRLYSDTCCMQSCLECKCAIVEFTQAGKNLAERGLPRLTPSTNLLNYEE